MSQQTLYGGPAYFIRNIIYNAPKAIKHHSNPSGLIYYHNTFITRVEATQASNYHFRNNLILGWLPSETVFSVETFTNYTSSDYNGFRTDPEADFSFKWNSPTFTVQRDYTGQMEERQFKSLAEYSLATGQDKNSIEVDYDIFINVNQVDSTSITKVFKSDELDFTLKPGSAAIEAGCVLHNVNDFIRGKAPDLGALETGQDMPIYGPRPDRY
jgi:hypothetical protein